MDYVCTCIFSSELVLYGFLMEAMVFYDNLPSLVSQSGSRIVSYTDFAAKRGPMETSENETR
jgi:hypothetical protein